MSSSSKSTGGWPREDRSPVVFVLTGDWGPQAQVMVDLANEMLGYARRWEDLGSVNWAIACHQAAANYALAAVQMQSLNPVPTQGEIDGLE